MINVNLPTKKNLYIKLFPKFKLFHKNEDTPYTPVKYNGHTGGKVTPTDSKSTRLQELSLMNNTYFGNIHYDIHLDMKLDYTISRIFQEMSLSELETLHQLCELERTQILQSLALAVLKIGQIFLITKETFYGFILAPKKCHHYTFLKRNAVAKESQYSTKIKYILSIHFQDEHTFGIPQFHVDLKIATMSYN